MYVFNGKKYEKKANGLIDPVSVVKSESPKNEEIKNEKVTKVRDSTYDKNKVSSDSSTSLPDNNFDFYSQITTSQNKNILLISIILSLALVVKVGEYSRLSIKSICLFVFNFFFVFVTLFFVIYSYYNSNSELKNASSQVEESKSKPWEPAVFVLNEDHFPVNYTGIDPKQFLQLYKSKIDSLKLTKDEFETTEEFKKRLSKKDVILAPLSTSALYAFRLDKILIRYDADSQSYVIGNEYSGCKSVNPDYLTDEKENDWYTCEVATIFHYSDSYAGSNAFGVSIPITRIIDNKFSLAIKQKKSLNKVFTLARYSKEYIFEDRVFIPIEKARSLRDKTIGILFVGQLSELQIIKGRGYNQKPTMYSPSEIIENEEAIPFNIKNIYYYVIETGEIIGQKELI